MNTSRGPADASGQDTDSTTAPGTAHERVKKTLLEFSWSNHGLDEVEDTCDDPGAQDWADELAAEIIADLA